MADNRSGCLQKRRFGVAIFGIGRAGQIHLKNVMSNRRLKLIWMVDVDLEHTDRMSNFYRMENVGATTPSDSKTVLGDDRVDMVIVASPTFTHERIVLEALSYGKAVFCEKPIALDTARVIKCYDEAEKQGKPLFCSFNRRFDPMFVDLRKRKANGDVGQVYMVKTCSRDNPVPSTEYLKISGGIFHDCAVHDIDIVNWVLGEFPMEVYVAAHAHKDDIAVLGDVDTVAITLKFPSNTIAIIDLSRMGRYGYHQTLEVFGSKGMLMAENQRPTALQYSTESGATTVPIDYSFPQRYEKSYINALDNFVDILEGKSGELVTKEEVVNVATIASACEESLRTGTVVKIHYQK